MGGCGHDMREGGEIQGHGVDERWGKEKSGEGSGGEGRRCEGGKKGHWRTGEVGGRKGGEVMFTNRRKGGEGGMGRGKGEEGSGKRDEGGGKESGGEDWRGLEVRRSTGG